ncbi:hypothetical protein BGZ59_000847 [Podila verticillata]|nr:hypothetical protein BGZ59_000847 [Podila verticillata]KFH64366.1 hypothetical protein MVEG_10191 [Podila verticillata NRRL 6337]
MMWNATCEDLVALSGMYPKPVSVANASVRFPTVMDTNRTAVFLNSTLFKSEPSDPVAIRTLFAQLGTECYFFYSMHYFDRQMSNSDQKAYVFRFHCGRASPLRTCLSHSVNFGTGSVAPLPAQTGDDKRLARQVLDRFTTSAKLGNSNPSSGLVGNMFSNPDVTSVDWKSVDDSNPVLELNMESSPSAGAENEHCPFVDNMLQYVVWLKQPTVV